MTIAAPNTLTTLVTVDAWLRDPAKRIAEAKDAARAEGAREWEVAIESGGVVRVLQRGKV